MLRWYVLWKPTPLSFLPIHHGLYKALLCNAPEPENLNPWFLLFCHWWRGTALRGVVIASPAAIV